MCDPFIVESQAVDHRAVFVKPEDARLGISRLRFRRHATKFGKTESEAQNFVDNLGMLVETGGEADGVLKLETA